MTMSNGQSDIESFDVVIAGAGHGGAQTAFALRREAFAGTIAVIGAEPELPYERPPLSKAYLLGQLPFERMLIRSPEFWDKRQVEFRTSRRVIAVDAERHLVHTDVGERIGYRHLVWAAGGEPRQIDCPGHALSGIHSVRTRADIERIKAELPSVRRVAIIGGGYIGLEAAAALTPHGKPITLLESQDRVLARVTGKTLSRFYEAQHRARGVDVRLDVRVSCLEEENGRVRGVRLADGEVIPADLVIVGIGIVPSVQPLRDAGAKGGIGVRVDQYCRTSLPDVFAIGDCAEHVNRYGGTTPIRLESVQNANDMASTVAKAITGTLQAYDTLPWFWSTQYDFNLQSAGLCAGADREVLRGNIEDGAFSILYLRDDRLIAIDAVNAARDFAAARMLIESGIRVDETRLSDSRNALRDLAAAAAVS